MPVPPPARLSSPAHWPAEIQLWGHLPLGSGEPEGLLFIFSEKSWSDGNFFEVITSQSQLGSGRALWNDPGGGRAG